MRILFLSNLYPPHHIGGYEMLCHEVATKLTERGHLVTILTSTYGRDGLAEDEPGIHRRLRLESDIYHYQPQRILRYWSDSRSNREAVGEVVAVAAPDVAVVWGMWNLSRLVAVWLEELVTPARVAYYLSDQWAAEPSAHEAYWDGPENGAASAAFKRGLRLPVRLALWNEWRPFDLQLKNVAVCSHALRNELTRRGVPVDRAKVIYHGIDPTPYRQAAERHRDDSPSDVLRVVFVGTLAPHKGVHTAIAALGHLSKDGMTVPTRLTVLGAGDPDYEARLHRLAEHWQLGDRVAFHRPIPRAQLPAFLAQFDVLVMPSVYEEPQARISQEAMAAGLALVATSTGGTPEILVDGHNGLTFEPEDAHGLARQLQRLAESAALRGRLTTAALKTVMERFTITRMINELESFLRETAEQSEIPETL